MYIKFNNIEDFNNWHTSIMATLGIPDGLGTEVYSLPIVHPKDNTVAASIDERVDTQGHTVLSLNDMYELGYKILPTVPF
jgi:hypothetical protein